MAEIGVNNIAFLEFSIEINGFKLSQSMRGGRKWKVHYLARRILFENGNMEWRWTIRL